MFTMIWAMLHNFVITGTNPMVTLTWMTHGPGEWLAWAIWEMPWLTLVIAICAVVVKRRKMMRFTTA